jgi:PAS domain S-box-containing protein
LAETEEVVVDEWSEREYLAGEKARLEQELAVQRQIAFATGLFQKDVTIRTLLESLGQGVIVVDSNGYILLVNARAEHMFGYRDRDIVGKHHDIIIPLRFREMHRRHMEHYFSEPKIRPMGQGLDLIGIRSDGVEFPVEISLSYVRIQNTLLVLALVTDITLRVQAENARREHAEELAEANQALESFSFSVSHDLRAPLRTLMGFSRILLEDYADKLDDEGRGLLQRIASSGHKMNELIEDMLDLSRVAQVEMAAQQIDLTDMAKSIVRELREAEPERAVEVIVHGNLKARGDPKLIHIALSNLIGNAWKYTSKAEDPRIEIGARPRTEHTTFFVRDNGVGFDMQYADKLFSAFQRLHGDTEFPGTGIGLAIAARVISRHHGRIWAESRPEQGATFFFELD